MTADNRARPLAFAFPGFDALLVEDANGFLANGIVVNLSNVAVSIEAEIPVCIRPLQSAMLVNASIISAKRIAVLRISEHENLGGFAISSWTRLGDVLDGYPRTTPLYLSPTDYAGHIAIDPVSFCDTLQPSGTQATFAIELKCWWTPNNTDCGIHNEHPFLEVHTQLFGQGRMQKFRTEEVRTLYEEVIMVPGLTHHAFCCAGQDGSFKYPWHRYYTDHESIWLAIELHRPTGPA